mgnify:CR=1 FL=1
MLVEIWISQGQNTKKIDYTYTTMTSGFPGGEDDDYYRQTSMVVGILEEE